jgi:hypothetical protein
METDPKHSPLPWKVDCDPVLVIKENRIFKIQDANGNTIVKTDCGFYPPSKVDADFICLAVNAFERDREIKRELIEALKELDASADDPLHEKGICCYCSLIAKAEAE